MTGQLDVWLEMRKRSTSNKIVLKNATYSKCKSEIDLRWEVNHRLFVAKPDNLAAVHLGNFRSGLK